MSNRAQSPKVAVIVPVYNPGPNLARCTSSVVAQTMPAGELEAIFVDDGSTDGSGAALDALAAAYPHIRVIHQENSGWAGGPRNVGIDAATADFVLFLDADDGLGPEAAERLHARAVKDGSDIVLGRSVGHGRPNGSQLSWRTRGPLRFEEDPALVGHLKTHKLMRRAFLNEHGLRFLEGKRRLEDQIFVLEAYFLATGISVVGDYACYHHHRRTDSTGLAAQPWEPADYYRSVRDDIRIIERYTEPGAFRNRLLQRIAATEMLKRLCGPMFLRATPERQSGLVREIRSILEDHIPLEVDARLIPPVRVVAALARAGRLDLLVAMAEAEERTKPTAVARRVEWRPGAGLVLEIDIALADVRDGIALGPNEPDGWALGVPAGVEQVVSPEVLVTDQPVTNVIELLAIDAGKLVTAMETSATFVEDQAPGSTGGWALRMTALLPIDAALPRKRRGTRELRFFARLHVTPHLQRAGVEVSRGVALKRVVLTAPPKGARGGSRYVASPGRTGNGRLLLVTRPTDLRSRLRRAAIRVRHRLRR
jgi:poly(ribitol-phosphate) beta-N-acetylglucosaminyltransferase